MKYSTTDMKTQANCGDWHLGWGYSGNDKVGKLSKVDGNYLWEGHSQGRHGATWNYGAFLKFKVKGDDIEVIEYKGNYPRKSELLKGIEERVKLKKTFWMLF